MCGEKCYPIAILWYFIGSTPRVWGKEWISLSMQKLIRFNPTCVGKRVDKFVNAKTYSVQPHVCGEKLEHDRPGMVPTVQPHVCGEKRGRNLYESVYCGSTPRVWGKGRTSVPMESRKWFNPTCVGKSLLNLTAINLLTVQPHVCGEKNGFDFFVEVCFGSTPRVWGKG